MQEIYYSYFYWYSIRSIHYSRLPGQNIFSYVTYDWWQYSGAVVHELMTRGELSLTNQILQQQLLWACGMQRKGLETLGPLHVIISCNLNRANKITERTIWVVWSHEHGHFDIDSLCLSGQYSAHSGTRNQYQTTTTTNEFANDNQWVCFRCLCKGCKSMCELRVWQQEVVVTLQRAGCTIHVMHCPVVCGNL